MERHPEVGEEIAKAKQHSDELYKGFYKRLGTAPRADVEWRRVVRSTSSGMASMSGVLAAFIPSWTATPKLRLIASQRTILNRVPICRILPPSTSHPPGRSRLWPARPVAGELGLASTAAVAALASVSWWPRSSLKLTCTLIALPMSSTTGV